MGIRRIIYDSYFGKCIDRWGDTFIGFNPDPIFQNELLYSERAITWWLVIRCDIEHSKRRPKDWFNPYNPQTTDWLAVNCKSCYSMSIRRPRKLKNRTAKNEYNKITKELCI